MIYHIIISMVLHCVCVCVCVFSSHHLLWTSSSLDVPAGATQEEGYTGFFIHLPSAVRALDFLARRIQPFLSLFDLIVLHSMGIFIYLFIFSEKNPVCRDRTHAPTCQKVSRLPLSYRGDRPHCIVLYTIKLQGGG